MKKILVVEDEIAYLKLLNKELTIKGYEVIEAKDGKEGLEKAKDENPDLILLDLRMPVMDGMTMLEQFRKDAHGKSAKVIVLTNLEPDDKIIEQVIATKPAYYFVKSDIKLEDLMEKIAMVLAKE